MPLLRHCLYCRKALHRKRYANGELELNRNFARRQFCNRRCAARARQCGEFKVRVSKCSCQKPATTTVDRAGKKVKVCDGCRLLDVQQKRYRIELESLRRAVDPSASYGFVHGARKGGSL